MSADVRAGLPSMSGAERDFGCPGNRNLARGLESKEHAWTKDGTLGHSVLAGDESEAALLNREDLQFAVSRSQELVNSIAETHGFSDPDEIIIEERIWLHDQNGEPVGSGQVDRALIKGRSALLFDYKLGRKIVTRAPLNKQMIGGGVLLSRDRGVDEAWVAIVQPWAKPGPLGHMDSETLDAWYWMILEAWAKTADPEAKRTPGPWCDYCPARGKCQEAIAEFSQLAMPQGYDLRIPGFAAQLWDVADRVEKTAIEVKGMIRDAIRANPAAFPEFKVGADSEVLTIPASNLRQLLPPETVEQLVGDPEVTVTEAAIVLSGGRPGATYMNKKAKEKKAEIKETWAPYIKAAPRKGKIERISA